MKNSFEIELSSHFIKQVRKRNSNERQQISQLLVETQASFGIPHQHHGLGIRRLSKTIFECRFNLSTRLVFEKSDRTLFFHFIGNHDEVKVFLKNN